MQVYANGSLRCHHGHFCISQAGLPILAAAGSQNRVRTGKSLWKPTSSRAQRYRETRRLPRQVWVCLAAKHAERRNFLAGVGNSFSAAGIRIALFRLPRGGVPSPQGVFLRWGVLMSLQGWSWSGTLASVTPRWLNLQEPCQVDGFPQKTSL